MKYAFLDLFCGAGGTSTGINDVEDAFVFACVNHDKNAILSHKSNHPSALHFTEDIRSVKIEPLVRMAKKIRKQYPGIKICLWASLECTNHSNAKGGMSRDADSRTLADHLFRYFAIGFDMVFIENVREFQQWGPLRIKAKAHTNYSELIMSKPTKKYPISKYIMIPVKAKKGVYYRRWVNKVQGYGFQFDDALINCADLGCPTTRKRLFIQFAKPGIRINWPQPTHSKTGANGLPEWKPVGPLLDLQSYGESIFTRKKPMAAKTYLRVHKGALRHGAKPHITKYYGNGDNVSSLAAPCPTLTTKDRCYLTTPFLISEYGMGGHSNVTSPAPTLTTVPKQKIVTTHFLLDHQFGNEGTAINKPCPTLIARQDKKPKYLVTSQFLMSLKTSKKGTKHEYEVVENNTTANKSIIHKGDCPELIELKKFMQEHGIFDIKMRALEIEEMLKIMTFPTGYKLVGTKTEKKKYIGNAVPSWAAKQIIQTSVLANRV